MIYSLYKYKLILVRLWCVFFEIVLEDYSEGGIYLDCKGLFNLRSWVVLSKLYLYFLV